jgi:hypothetical protein
MNGEQLGQFRKHPLRAEQLLMPLEDLRGAAHILRSQLERFDGQGFPDRLSGFNIPLGARILALASDYDDLQTGMLMQRRLRPEEAIPAIIQARGSRYDPQVVAAFQEIISGKPAAAAPELELRPEKLLAGMVLSRDLITADGFLLLSAENRLDERTIRQIVDFDESSGNRLVVHVYPPPRST